MASLPSSMLIINSFNVLGTYLKPEEQAQNLIFDLKFDFQIKNRCPLPPRFLVLPLARQLLSKFLAVGGSWL